MKATKTGTPDTMSNKKPPKVTTIADTFHFGQLNRGISRHKMRENAYPLQNPIPVDYPNDLVGIEIEMEGIRNPTTMDYYWEYKTDGSLRNNGAEYASLPLRVEQVQHALIYLNEQLAKSLNNKPTFSPRTSVHVHVNVRDISWEHLENFVLLYAIFERHFFLQTTPDREKGIFCVPLYRTDMLERLHPIENVSGRWHKYAAINLCTVTGAGDMGSYGTIEFRHMYGTMDPKDIVPWINQIVRLKTIAGQYKRDELRTMIKTMNTTSAYLGLYSEVFGKYAKPQAMLKADFEYCITMAKLGLFADKQPSCSVNSRYYNKYRKLLDTKTKGRAAKLCPPTQDIPEPLGNWDTPPQHTETPKPKKKITPNTNAYFTWNTLNNVNPTFAEQLQTAALNNTNLTQAQITAILNGEA